MFFEVHKIVQKNFSFAASTGLAKDTAEFEEHDNVSNTESERGHPSLGLRARKSMDSDRYMC